MTATVHLPNSGRSVRLGDYEDLSQEVRSLDGDRVSLDEDRVRLSEAETAKNPRPLNVLNEYHTPLRRRLTQSITHPTYLPGSPELSRDSDPLPNIHMDYLPQASEEVLSGSEDTNGKLLGTSEVSDEQGKRDVSAQQIRDAEQYICSRLHEVIDAMVQLAIGVRTRSDRGIIYETLPNFNAGKFIIERVMGKTPDIIKIDDPRRLGEQAPVIQFFLPENGRSHSHLLPGEQKMFDVPDEIDGEFSAENADDPSPGEVTSGT